MMNVRFSKDTDEDFSKHRKYLRRTGKSDGNKYQKYELDGIQKHLKKDIKDGLKKLKEHKGIKTHETTSMFIGIEESDIR